MFDPTTKWLFGVHAVDLAPEGRIGAHVDSIKFSGEILSGLSLLSPCVMTLRRDPKNSEHKSPDGDDIAKKHLKNHDTPISVDLLLEPRSLYILTSLARWEFTHEIPSGSDVVQFGDKSVQRARRISVMFRNEAIPSASSEQGVASLKDSRY
eukprot:TRINITY_DN2607_c0_g1_i3.p1 TRINITY_DN2607_c0_g1~~TRINITY_DN2607_c0_g1_i3.p1  ORF type:complete len:152 (+),score=3.48 TRINITY_DN2607_c0_g1_i3:418-873(+)